MARRPFGGGTADFVASAAGGLLQVGAKQITFWTTPTPGTGTQYTDLLNAGGGAVTSLVTDANGQLPSFQGPADGTATMWADAGGAARQRMDATDTISRVAAVETVANLVPVAIKSAAYTAAAGDLVPVDTTSGVVPITLPTTPADNTRISVKVVNGTATNGSLANSATVAAGGSAVFNKTGGSTTISLTQLNQQMTFQYKAAGAIWYVTDSPSLAQILLGNATSAATLNDRGTWAAATAYAVGDAVKTAGVRYACKVAHTSSSSFSTDAASKWVQLGIDSTGAAVLPADAAGVLTNDGSGTLTWGSSGARPVATVSSSGASRTLALGATRMTLTANCTFAMPSAAAGILAVVDLTLVQDGTGSRTVSWPASVKWPSATAPTLTTTAGRADRLRLVSDDGGASWFGVVLGQNYTPAASAFSDNFNRADSSSVGNGWTDYQSQPAEILSGVVMSGGSVSGIVRDLGSADGTVTLKVSSGDTLVVVRYVDANNFWAVSYAGRLSKIVAGSGGNPAVYNNVGNATFPCTCSVVMSGNNFSVYADGVLMQTATDSFNATATKHGLQVSTGTTTADDFTYAP